MSPRTPHSVPQQEERPLYENRDIILVPKKLASQTGGRRFLRVGEDDNLFEALPEPVYWNDEVIFLSATDDKWYRVSGEVEITDDDFIYHGYQVTPEESEWLDALLDFELDKNI